MTLFEQEVERIRSNVFANVYLTRQILLAKSFIDTHYQHGISLYDICRAAGVSKFHLIRSFRNLYGTTPNQYLISVRVEHARKLLLAGLAVSDACYSVGFSSPTTFSGLFKKFTGVPPARFRRSMTEKSNFEEVFFLPSFHFYRKQEH